jgi:cell division protein FtsQ
VSVTWLGDTVARGRRRSLRARLAGTALLLAGAGALAGTGWWAWDAGHLDTRRVLVTGTVRVDAAQVEAIGAAAAAGTPLVAVDVGAVHEQVAAMPLVLEVAVERRWPRTLEVVVTERVAVAAVPSPGGGVDVVDEEGVVLATQPEPPPGVPLLRVDVQRDGADTLAAARTVLAAMPVELQQRTSEVSATSPADVRLVVDGTQVRWGTAADSERKVEVLAGLMAGVPGSVYDVSAPSAPAVTP